MRYLIDTNIFIYLATDPERLSKDVAALLEYDADLYMSAESVKEVIVAFRNKGFTKRRWKTESDAINSIGDDYRITVLPVDMNVMRTYSKLELNVREGHKDPSDHIIISHAMTLHMPLISSDHKFLFYKQQGLDLIYNE